MNTYHHQFPNQNEVIVNTHTVAYVLLINLTPGEANDFHAATLDIYFVGATDAKQEPSLRFWYKTLEAAHEAHATFLDSIS